MPALRISVGLVVNPLILGSAAISFMPARSAPSAKSFTLSCLISIDTPFPLSRAVAFLEDEGRRFGQRFYCNVRLIGPLFGVSVVDEVIFATRRLARGDVAPAVAHQKAALKFYAELVRGFEQHAGLRLAAGAMVRIGVEAHLDEVDAKAFAEKCVYLLDRLASLLPRGDIRLVRHDDVQESATPKAFQRRGNARQDLQFLQRVGGIRLTVAHHAAVEDAVAVEKYRPSRPAHHLTTPLPLGCDLLQGRVRDEAMPNHGVERLGVRRHAPRIHRRNDDYAVADLLGIAAVPAHD